MRHKAEDHYAGQEVYLPSNHEVWSYLLSMLDFDSATALL